MRRGTPFRRSIGKVLVARSYWRLSTVPAGISITARNTPSLIKAGSSSRSVRCVVPLFIGRSQATRRSINNNGPALRMRRKIAQSLRCGASAQPVAHTDHAAHGTRFPGQVTTVKDVPEMASPGRFHADGPPVHKTIAEVGTCCEPEDR